MAASLIDTPTALTAFLDDLPDLTGSPPSLYVDLEGNNLSREGTISLITILVYPRDEVHLIDVTTLKRAAFTTKSSDDRTLQQILEASDITKVFFDIRHDSDALFALYGVHVSGICDLQLMQLATRTYDRRYVNGLAKCIDRDSQLSAAEKVKWQKVKDRGCQLFDPQRGGSYAVFDQRPLSPDMLDYCVQDVVHMPALWNVYCATLCDAWWDKITKETDNRIKASHAARYNGQGKHMALAPPGWLHWQPTATQRRVRTLVEGKCSIVPKARVVTVEELMASMSFADSSGFGRGREEAEDFAACNSECGYCGHCDY